MIKTFNELTPSQVYEILKARAAIFVVEQNCVYQDMDDIDYQSLHIYLHGRAVPVRKQFLKMTSSMLF